MTKDASRFRTSLLAAFPLLAALLAPVAGCSAGAAGVGGAAPPRATLTAKGPVGLFFMTRYWSGGSLEMAAWYFGPDGRVYQDLAEGFTAELLAKHAGPKGVYTYAGSTMEVRWSDGKTTKSAVEKDKDPNTFMWDMGIFTSVEPLGDAKALVGRYEGGHSLAGERSSVANSHSLDLRPDGTYTLDSVASVKGTGAGTAIAAGGAGKSHGHWTASGYTLTLTADDGTVTRRIAFPYDDGSTPGKANRLYLGGTMFKRS